MEQEDNPNQDPAQLFIRILEDFGQEVPDEVLQTLIDASTVLGSSGPIDEYIKSHLKQLIVDHRQTRQVTFRPTINLEEDWGFLRDCVALANSLQELDEAVGDKGYIVLGAHDTSNLGDVSFDPTEYSVKEMQSLLQRQCDQHIEPKVHLRYRILKINELHKKTFGLVVIEKASHRPVYLKEDAGAHWTPYVRSDPSHPHTSLATREAISSMFLRSQWPHLVAQVLDEDYRKRIHAITVLGSESTKESLSRDQYHLVSQLLIGLLLDPHINVVMKALDALMMYEPDERCNRALIALCTPQVLMPICPTDGYDDSDTTEEEISNIYSDTQPTKKSPDRLLKRLLKVLQKTASIDLVPDLEFIRDAYSKSTEINVLSKNTITMLFNSSVEKIRLRYRKSDPEVFSSPQQQPSRSKLLDALDKSFNEDECKEIIFTMNMDYENLSGETKRGKFIELILKFEREKRLYELGDVCKELRPSVDWIALTK